MLDNTWNRLSKFRTTSWVEINDKSRGTYNTNCQINFKNTMLKSSLHNYSDSYIFIKGTITVVGVGADTAAKQADKRNTKVLFKNHLPLIGCISNIDNTRVDNSRHFEAIMSMYNLTEYRDSYSNTLGSLWLYYRDKPALENNGNIFLVIVPRSNLKQKLQERFLMMVIQKMLE